jgi:hypothetical protein
MTTTESGGFLQRTLMLGDQDVCVTSYQVGKRFSARADNVNPGANIGRGMGNTREDAELAALTTAAGRLGVRMTESELRACLGAVPRVETP